MAYSGSTAASSVANPPIRIGGAMTNTCNTLSTAGSGAQLWLYNSSHSSTQLTDTDFFSDAYYLGMKKGDVVMFMGSTGSSGAVGLGILGAVTTSGAALSSTGGIVSSTR
jgi:hypothetical protein